jgi:hypothetical protein
MAVDGGIQKVVKSAAPQAKADLDATGAEFLEKEIPMDTVTPSVENGFVLWFTPKRDGPCASKP